MSVAAVILGPARGRTRPQSPSARRRPEAPSLAATAAAAAGAGYDELVVVLAEESAAAALPEVATVLLEDAPSDQAGALQAAIDWSQRQGHTAVVVAFAPRGAAGLEADTGAWRALRDATGASIVVAGRAGVRSGLVRLAAEAWPLLPLEGDPAKALEAHSDLTRELEVPPGTAASGPSGPAATSSEDRERVAELLGRPVAGEFSVAVRDAKGWPVVIENAPFLDDGTPMPTRYWLVGRDECEAVARLESAGGVRRAAAEVPAGQVEATHRRYAERRDAAIGKGHRGPRPSGGVGGTRVGVKCLHAHLAYYLAGGGDPVGRWVAGELAGELAGPVAAIDCGTNSTRLLVVSVTGESLAREMTITRLGEGTDRTGELAPAAISRTVEALRRYREVMDENGVVALRAVATSAARDAGNAEVFFSRAEEVLGVRPELLEGVEEGRLSYLGATTGLPEDDGPFLVADLGGGSTELVAGGEESREPAAVVSLDLGCVRVTERFFRADPPTDSEIGAARTFVSGEIARALFEFPALGKTRALVGVAGTVSTLVQLAIGLDRYDGAVLHHRWITAEKTEALARELLSVTTAERRARPGIEPGRADVIAAGALIFSGVMAGVGFSSARYSESDILDGIVAGLRAERPAR